MKNGKRRFLVMMLVVCLLWSVTFSVNAQNTEAKSENHVAGETKSEEFMDSLKKQTIEQVCYLYQSEDYYFLFGEEKSISEETKEKITEHVNNLSDSFWKKLGDSENALGIQTDLIARVIYYHMDNDNMDLSDMEDMDTTDLLYYNMAVIAIPDILRQQYAEEHFEMSVNDVQEEYNRACEVYDNSMHELYQQYPEIAKKVYHAYSFEDGQKISVVADLFKRILSQIEESLILDYAAQEYDISVAFLESEGYQHYEELEKVDRTARQLLKQYSYQEKFLFKMTKAIQKEDLSWYDGTGNYSEELKELVIKRLPEEFMQKIK